MTCNGTDNSSNPENLLDDVVACGVARLCGYMEWVLEALFSSIPR